jgi:hypothetical protein
MEFTKDYMRATCINNTTTKDMNDVLSVYNMSEHNILNIINSKFINDRWPISISYVEDNHPMMGNVNGIGGGSRCIGNYYHLNIIIKDNYGQEHKNTIVNITETCGKSSHSHNFDISFIFNNDLKQLCDYDIRYNKGERSQDLIYTMSSIITEKQKTLENNVNTLKADNMALKEENADLKNRIEQMEKKMNTLMEFIMLMR